MTAPAACDRLQGVGGWGGGASLREVRSGEKVREEGRTSVMTSCCDSIEGGFRPPNNPPRRSHCGCADCVTLRKGLQMWKQLNWRMQNLLLSVKHLKADPELLLLNAVPFLLRARGVSCRGGNSGDHVLLSWRAALCFLFSL